MTRTHILLIILLTFISSCARISSPTGGPQDKEPPILVSSNPKDGQTQYNQKTITLVFDEAITARSIENNLIITPSMAGNFKTKIKRNTIQLLFDSAWRENTTYSLNFGNSIEDLNEGNVPSNLFLSFATGETIDSLTISGTITNLYTGEPIKQALVSLYPSSDTLDITSGAALYLTKTDSAGNYRFQNLPTGNFLVYGVLDKNNNSKADTDKELYGFLKDTVKLTENISGQSFALQRLNIQPLSIKTNRHYGKYYDITFNKSITSYQLESTDLNELDHQLYASDKIRIYNTQNIFGDTTSLVLHANDSINSQLKQTIKVYFNKSDLTGDRFTQEILPTSPYITNKFELKVNFNKPINTYNPQKAILKKDSINTFLLPDSVLHWNDTKTEITWALNASQLIIPGEQIQAIFEPGAFISIESDTSTLIQKTYQVAKPQDSGLIEGTITTDAPNFIIQLLNNQNRVLRELYNVKTYSFNNLDAGNYQVRLIIDTNNNKSLDVGNILTRTNSEPIVFYTDPVSKSKMISVKKNWEIGDINISYTVNKTN
ncbi:Ig-like domain-containing protein [Roseivirga echinicomitans]